MPEYETIEVGGGSFVGWGNTPGQFVEGKVLDYDTHGGHDFDGNICPQLDIELITRAASFDKHLNRTDYEPGEQVSVTCGLKNLKKAIKTVDPQPGDTIKITLSELITVKSGTLKKFAVGIARSSGANSGNGFAGANDEPPF